MNTIIVSTAEFRLRGYSEQDQQELREALETLGYVRLRGIRMREAGGLTELWLFITFVATSFAAGVLEAFGFDVYRNLAKRLSVFLRRKAQRDGFDVELHTITLSFDDVDVIFHYPSTEMISKLDKIILDIQDIIKKGSLREMKKITRIDVPVENTSEGWSNSLPPNQYLYNDPRYIGISTDGEPGVEYVFDLKENKIVCYSRNEHISEVSNKLLLENLLLEYPGSPHST